VIKVIVLNLVIREIKNITIKHIKSFKEQQITFKNSNYDRSIMQEFANVHSMRNEILSLMTQQRIRK